MHSLCLSQAVAAGAAVVGTCALLAVQSVSSTGSLNVAQAEGKKATQMPAPKSQEADTKFNTEDFALFSGRANPAVSRECSSAHLLLCRSTQVLCAALLCWMATSVCSCSLPFSFSALARSRDRRPARCDTRPDQHQGLRRW
jgi:hypothetical protein